MWTPRSDQSGHAPRLPRHVEHLAFSEAGVEKRGPNLLGMETFGPDRPLGVDSEWSRCTVNAQPSGDVTPKTPPAIRRRDARFGVVWPCTEATSACRAPRVFLAWASASARRP